MEFEEIFTSPFTTQTTCYSCGRKQIGSESADLQFATENHILSVRIPDDDDHVKTSCRSLPRDAAQMTCVGYDSWEEEQESDNDYTTVYHMEAMALIDPEILDDDNPEALTEANLHRPSTLPVDRDDASSAVTTTRSQTNTLRRVSSFATATTATSTTNNPPLSQSGGSYHRKSQSELSKGSIITSDSQQSLHTTHNSSNHLNTTIETSSTTLVEAPQTKSKARLVLKQDRYSIRKSLLKASAESSGNCENEQDDSNDHAYRRQLRQSSFALLDFRPLCPCIAQWGGNPYIWVGSADDAMLRLYAPSGHDPRSLIPVLLPEEHFFIRSPVMGLDFLSHDGRHTLAVACQDGTIQLITWSDADKSAITKSIFGDLQSQKVIVDGPLVCLKLDCNQRVMVGSLCGFVCQLNWDDNSKLWEGPHMVVQDLLQNTMEESVLAVDVWKNYVAIGTHAGRCLLYATHDGENYFMVWQCVLPYPVHDICILTTNQETLKLAVTTRRSFHVFSKIRGKAVIWNEMPKTREKYSSELGKTKLENILKEIRKANQQLDLETQSSVREIVQDLLTKVETATPDTPTANVGTISNLMDRVEEYVASKEPDTTNLSSSADAPHWEYSSSDEEEEEEQTAENENEEEEGQKETKEEAEC